MNQTTNQNTSNGPKPWYKEPWPWFLMLGPAIVVVAGFFTYYLAVAYKDDMVVDDYYDEGQSISILLAKEQLAVDQHISANIIMNEDGSHLRAFLKSDAPLDEEVVLSIIHPAKGGMDQVVPLKLVDKNAQMYEAEFKPLPAMNNWLVQIENKDKTWRLQDKWIVSQGGSFALIPGAHQLAEQK